GRVEDLAASLAHLAGRWPGHPYVVCAFSLSGNILLRYLGELGHAPPPGLRAAMAVCPPVDLEQCSLALASPINAPIDRYYTRRLVATAKLRQRLALESRPLSLPRRLNLRIFDDVYTAPRAG